MTKIEQKLIAAKDSVVLSEAEKSIHRERLQAFMDMHPAVAPQKHALWAFAPAFRYAFIALLIFSVGSGSIAFAAEKALPGQPLYVVKTRINEPVAVAFTLDAHDRADLKVELANKRLKEFAQISKEQDVAPETVALVAELLEQHITEASEDIALLSEQGEGEEALQANADLQSTLSAHQSILEKVEDVNPEASEQIQVITDQIADGITDTATAAAALETSLDIDAAPTTDLEVFTQEQDTQESLAELSQKLTDAAGTLDTADHMTLETRLTEVQAIVAEAEAKTAADQESEAFILYNDADQQILELTTLLEAKVELHLDVLNPEE